MITLAYNVTTEGEGTGTYKKAGTAPSNSTGHVPFTFTPDSSYDEGKQNWRGFVDITETCYNYNESGVFNVTIQKVRTVDLVNITVDPSSGEWGFNFSFNVTAQTDSPYNVTFTLYISNSTGGPWDDIGNVTLNITNQWKMANFTWDPECGEIGSRFFYIHADDDQGTTNQTTVQAFTVEKDTVYLDYYSGNNTETRRNSFPTSLLVTATDMNGSLIENLTLNFYVTLDGSTWDSGTANYTNSTGHGRYDFLAGCSPKYQVDVQKWRVRIEDDTCYKNNNTEDNYYLTLNVTGDIELEFVKPD
ncbi:MAG: hypothetical protein KAT35_03750, partial [Candidatus Aenigmarchaeota archaeon]|nr:hypothetical protein [Candidatus Aenigmarchaeota archaeon]